MTVPEEARIRMTNSLKRKLLDEFDKIEQVTTDPEAPSLVIELTKEIDILEEDISRFINNYTSFYNSTEYATRIDEVRNPTPSSFKIIFSVTVA